MIKKITSLQHPLIKHLVRLRQNSDYRYDHHSLVIEGIKTVSEVGVHQHIKTLFAFDESFFPSKLEADEKFLVTQEIMQKVSGMKTPEGLFAEIAMPKSSLLGGMNKIVAVDRVSDPGNLGTILRTALAFGWEGVFILNESCDPFNEKALRAARGATFRLPIRFGSWQDAEKLISDNQFTPFAGDLHGANIHDLIVPEKIFLVLGSESQGISSEAEAVCKKVTIPMGGPMESLNVAVAAGILLFLLNSTTH